MTPNELLRADLTAQSAALGSGAVTSVALTEAVLAEIERTHERLNAYLHRDAEAALRAARESDARLAAGHSRGALDGLTLGVKDNIDVAGMPTTAGMAARRGRIAAHDAFVVARLRAAGMVVLGKLNMHEAALGATNANAAFGRCEHPQRAGYTPGGSSGGSACAAAAGLCALALGSDTMGSVRLPAAYCGVVGMKGSFGLVSTAGSVACGRVLDHIGPIVRSQRDLKLVWPVIAAYDAAWADARPVPALLPIERPRFVAARDVAAAGAEPAVAAAYHRAVSTLRERGANVTEVDIGGWDFGRARRAGLLIVEADLLVEHADDWRAQPQNFSPGLAKGLRWAEAQPASAYAAALKEIARAHVEAARWFAHGDVMLLPTTPQTAFPFDAPVPANQADFTSVANLAGVPAVSLPLPVAAGELPIGLQAIAPLGHDLTLIDLDLLGVT